MSADRKKSVGMRVVKFLLGTDQPALVAAAAGVSIAFGLLVIFHAIYFSTRPIPPLWQAIGAGLVLGLFIMPFFFIAIYRASLFMSHWEALAMLTAAMICPLAIWRLEASGVNPFLILSDVLVYRRRLLDRASNCKAVPFMLKLMTEPRWPQSQAVDLGEIVRLMASRPLDWLRASQMKYTLTYIKMLGLDADRQRK